MTRVPGGVSKTGIQCLAAVAQYFGLRADPDHLVRQCGNSVGEPDVGTVIRFAMDMGLRAKAGKMTWESLLAATCPFPFLAKLANGNWVVVIGLRPGEPDRLAILDPLEGRAAALLLRREQFCSQWGGEVVVLSADASLTARAA